MQINTQKSQKILNEITKKKTGKIHKIWRKPNHESKDGTREMIKNHEQSLYI